MNVDNAEGSSGEEYVVLPRPPSTDMAVSEIVQGVRGVRTQARRHMGLLAQVLRANEDEAKRAISSCPCDFLSSALALVMAEDDPRSQKQDAITVLVFILQEPSFWRCIPFKPDDTLDNILSACHDDRDNVRHPCLCIVTKIVLTEGPLKDKVITKLGGPRKVVSILNTISANEGYDDGLVLAVKTLAGTASLQNILPYLEFILNRVKHIREEEVLVEALEFLKDHPIDLRRATCNIADIMDKVSQQPESARRIQTLLLDIIFLTGRMAEGLSAEAARTVLSCVAEAMVRADEVLISGVHVMRALAPSIAPNSMPLVLDILDWVVTRKFPPEVSQNNLEDVLLELIFDLSPQCVPFEDPVIRDYLREYVMRKVDVTQLVGYLRGSDDGGLPKVANSLMRAEVISHLTCHAEVSPSTMDLLRVLYSHLTESSAKEEAYEGLSTFVIQVLGGDLKAVSRIMRENVTWCLQTLPLEVAVNLEDCKRFDVLSLLEWEEGPVVLERLQCHNDVLSGLKVKSVRGQKVLRILLDRQLTQCVPQESILLMLLTVLDGHVFNMSLIVEDLFTLLEPREGANFLNFCQLLILERLAKAAPGKVVQRDLINKISGWLKGTEYRDPVVGNMRDLPATTTTLAVKVLGRCQVSLKDVLDVYLSTISTVLQANLPEDAATARQYCCAMKEVSSMLIQKM